MMEDLGVLPESVRFNVGTEEKDIVPTGISGLMILGFERSSGLRFGCLINQAVNRNEFLRVWKMFAASKGVYLGGGRTAYQWDSEGQSNVMISELFGE